MFWPPSRKEFPLGGVRVPENGPGRNGALASVHSATQVAWEGRVPQKALVSKDGWVA